MATVTTTYGTKTTLTLDLSSLGTSSTFLSGIESAEISTASNSSMNNAVDFLLEAMPIVGHASTAPTVGQMISVWVWGSDTSLATKAIDTLDGTSSTETLSHAGVLYSLRPAASMVVTVATAALSYYMLPVSIAQLFGGVLPAYWGVYVAHNHTGALGASNNSLFTYQGIQYTVA